MYVSMYSYTCSDVYSDVDIRYIVYVYAKGTIVVIHIP